MELSFSIEFRELIKKSRAIAIDLGYDYISTVHFFIADCESGMKHSLMGFAFKSHHEFAKFKSSYNLNNEDLLSNLDPTLPLTTEATTVIYEAQNERKLCKHTCVYPCHFFLAALKNKNSLLSKCFKDDDSYQQLLKYYEQFPEFNEAKVIESDIEKENTNLSKKKVGFLQNILSLFLSQKQNNS